MSSPWDPYKGQLFFGGPINWNLAKRYRTESLPRRSKKNALTLGTTGMCHNAFQIGIMSFKLIRLSPKKSRGVLPERRMHPNSSVKSIFIKKYFYKSRVEILSNLNFPIERLSSQNNIPMSTHHLSSQNWQLGLTYQQQEQIHWGKNP